MRNEYLLTYTDTENKPTYAWFATKEKMDEFVDLGVRVIEKIRLINTEVLK